MAGLGLRGPLALDTNCLSYLVVGQDPSRQANMLVAMREAEAFGVQVSTLVVAELLVAPMKAGREYLARMAEEVADSGVFELVALDFSIARLTAEIRGLYGVKLPDAVVIATAAEGGADLLLSNDRQVVRAATEYIRAIYFDDWDPDSPDA